MKAQTKKPKREREKLINIRVSDSDYAAICRKAKKFTSGNISRWLRHVGIAYLPKASEFK